MNAKTSAGTEVGAGSFGLIHPAVELTRRAAGVCAALLSLAAVVLCFRRGAGALSSPLEPAVLAMVGATVAVTVASVRIARQYDSGGKPSSRLDWLAGAILSAAVLAIGFALSLPDTSSSGLVVLWIALGAEECWAWGPRAWRRLPVRRRRSPPAERKIGAGPPPSSRAPSIPSIPALDEPPADEVTQTLTRTRAADGSEVLSGWLRVAMAAGQRSANVHLAFCPEFLRTPRVTVEQVGGPEARIKKVQELPYGARFDLKLAVQSAEAATVLLKFSAKGAGTGTDPPAA